MNPIRYYFTLKHLKPIQIYSRFFYRLHSPTPKLDPTPPVSKIVDGFWKGPARRRASLLGPARCRFLNKERLISSPTAWNDPAAGKLWLYNLHYFDDLNAIDAGERTDWHRLLIDRWVAENPPGKGAGWEPYPTSLRIVNWVKWALAGNRLEPLWLHSLAVQTRWLSKRLEFHLLGNHLFANAKALVFAGLFFEGEEAETWLDKGMTILEREIPEQILPDGGQFERSPMYHALALEDLLDLVNLTTTYTEVVPDGWRKLVSTWPETIGRMRIWLAELCHPDGEIAFFNDAAIGIAPSPTELEAYAQRLDLPKGAGTDDIGHCGSQLTFHHPNPTQESATEGHSLLISRTQRRLPEGLVSGRRLPGSVAPFVSHGERCSLQAYVQRGSTFKISHYGCRHFADSGYIRVWRGSMVALLDVAPVGPDYLPGHTHADTLSFELSLFGQRLLVNSGTSRYDVGPPRLWQRSTAAHNTVTINGLDSSEVWGGFRVARRARPYGLWIEEEGDDLRIACSHAGYARLPGKPVHRREWRFSENALDIVDTIEGGFSEAVGRLYFHPGLPVNVSVGAGHVELAGARTLCWKVEGASCRIVPSEHFPEFGVAKPNQCLEMRFFEPSCLIQLRWN